MSKTVSTGLFYAYTTFPTRGTAGSYPTRHASLMAIPPLDFLTFSITTNVALSSIHAYLPVVTKVGAQHTRRPEHQPMRRRPHTSSTLASTQQRPSPLALIYSRLLRLAGGLMGGSADISLSESLSVLLASNAG